MKKVISLTVMILVISFTSMAGNILTKGNTNCTLGSFKVEKTIDQLVVNGVTLETYVISYENSEKKVKLAVQDDGKNKIFLVSSDDLDILYVCKSNFFGVEKPGKKFKKDGYVTDDTVLNRREYFNQKVITRSASSVKKCAGLIAVYYPQLIQDFEIAFACK